MKKISQKTTSIVEKLCTLETDWKDDFAIKVINFLDDMHPENFDNSKMKELLDRDFDVASTVFRLFLEKSKDEYTSTLKQLIPEKGMIGKNGYKKDKDRYISVFKDLLLKDKILEAVNREYTWKDIVTERLKSGRGSAIKGQKRGRQLEDFVENIVKQVFNTNYEPRCSFIGQNGHSTEKADFAIPNKENPEIIIEVKGYGATGSKQTDVIGDVNKIIQEKRHDSTFLLFTDGITWKERISDLRKLIKFQNEGYIYKIYTKQMKAEFLEDLKLLREEKNL